MKAKIYLDNDLIGTANFKIADESMGGIIANFIPNEHYNHYKQLIQSKTSEKGIANVSDFNFRIVVDNYELTPEGGIGITDLAELDEIIIEAAGLEQKIMERLKKEANR